MSRTRRAQVTIVLHPEVYAASSVWADELGLSMSELAEHALAAMLRAGKRPFREPPPDVELPPAIRR